MLLIFEIGANGLPEMDGDLLDYWDQEDLTLLIEERQVAIIDVYPIYPLFNHMKLGWPGISTQWSRNIFSYTQLITP
ncbi:MAG: hypothetical protein DI535_29005, partial [Citrobacter freundii]